jgi:hypothetical protein
MSAQQRIDHFWKWFNAQHPIGSPSRQKAVDTAFADLEAHEMEVRKFKHDAEEQALADWLRDAESYRDDFLMPLRHRESAEGGCFVNFYRSDWEEFSPAEGGCYWMRRRPVASFPLSFFDGTGYWGHPFAASAAQTTLERAKEYGRDKFGLTFEGDEAERSDGSKRKVFGLTSSRPEADAEVMLEQFPFQSAALVAPHYE